MILWLGVTAARGTVLNEVAKRYSISKDDKQWPKSLNMWPNKEETQDFIHSCLPQSQSQKTA